MLNNKWIEELNKVDERRTFALKYLGLLKDIACEHTQLRLTIENRPDQKPSDVNPYCKPWADGGLPISKQNTIDNPDLESRLFIRLTQYRKRMSALAIQYEHIYGKPSNSSVGGGS